MLESMDIHNGCDCTQVFLYLELQVAILPVLVQKLNVHLCLLRLLPAADVV